jgi:hypothetical protein
MTEEEIRDHAEALIHDHAQDVEFLSVAEHLADAEVDDPNDDLARAIHDKIRQATVTVTWPEAT